MLVTKIWLALSIFFLSFGLTFSQPSDFNCLFIPDVAQSPAPNALHNTENGWAFTPQGEMTTFVVLKATTPAAEADLLGWLPILRQLFYAPGTTFAANSADRTISNILYQNSIHSPNPLKITAAFFPVVVPANVIGALAIGQYITTYYQTNPPTGALSNLATLIDSRSGRPNFTQSIIGNGRDNLIDFTTEFTNSIQGAAFADGVNQPSRTAGATFSLPGVSGSLSISEGQTIRPMNEVQHYEIWLHEFCHKVLNQARHYGGANGIFGEYFHSQGTTHSLFRMGVREFVVNSQERLLLGWKTQNGQVTVSTSPTPQTFVLRDFVTSGDAIRVPLPGYNDQVLWLEYHNSVPNPIKQRLFNFDALSNPIPGFSTGLRGLIVRGNLSTDATGDAINSNGIRLLSAGGNHDYQIGATQPELRWWDNRVSNLITLQPNPTSETSSNTVVRDNIPEIDNAPTGASIIRYNSKETQNSGLPFPCNGNGLQINEQASGLKIDGNWVYEGSSQIGFNGVGTKLGLSSNPFLPLGHRRFNACNPRLEPILLNGLSIQIIAQTNTEITLQIRFDDTELNQPPSYGRLTGEIIVRPDLNENPVDLSITGDTRLELAKSKNRTTLIPGTGSFTNPTVLHSTGTSLVEIRGGRLVVADNSSLWLSNASKFNVEANSILRIEKGATLMLSDQSTLRVKAGATLIIEGAAYLCVGLGAKLIVEDGANLEVDPGFIDGKSTDLTDYLSTGDPSIALEQACRPICNRTMLTFQPPPLQIEGPLFVPEGQQVAYSLANPVPNYFYEWYIDGALVGQGFSIAYTGLAIGYHTLSVVAQPPIAGDCEIIISPLTIIVGPGCQSKVPKAIGYLNHLTSAEFASPILIDGPIAISGQVKIINTTCYFSDRRCLDPTGCTIALPDGSNAYFAFQEPMSGFIVLNEASLTVTDGHLQSYQCAGMWSGVRVMPKGSITMSPESSNGNQICSFSNSYLGLQLSTEAPFHIAATVFYNNLKQAISMEPQPAGSILKKCFFFGNGSKMLPPFQPIPQAGEPDKEFWPIMGINVRAPKAIDRLNVGPAHSFDGLVRGISVDGDAVSGIVEVANNKFSNCYEVAINVVSVELRDSKIDVPSKRPNGMLWIPFRNNSLNNMPNPAEAFGSYPLDPNVSNSYIYKKAFGTLAFETRITESTLAADLVEGGATIATIGTHVANGAEADIENNTYSNFHKGIVYIGSGGRGGTSTLRQNTFTDCGTGVLMQNSLLFDAFSCNTFQQNTIFGGLAFKGIGTMPWHTISFYDQQSGYEQDALGGPFSPCQNAFFGFNPDITATYVYPSGEALKYYKNQARIEENITSVQQAITFVDVRPISGSGQAPCLPSSGAQNMPASRKGFTTFVSRRFLDPSLELATASVQPTRDSLGNECLLDTGAILNQGYNKSTRVTSTFIDYRNGTLGYVATLDSGCQLFRPALPNILIEKIVSNQQADAKGNILALVRNRDGQARWTLNLITSDGQSWTDKYIGIAPYDRTSGRDARHTAILSDSLFVYKLSEDSVNVGRLHGNQMVSQNTYFHRTDNLMEAAKHGKDDLVVSSLMDEYTVDTLQIAEVRKYNTRTGQSERLPLTFPFGYNNFYRGAQFGRMSIQGDNLLLLGSSIYGHRAGKYLNSGVEILNLKTGRHKIDTTWRAYLQSIANATLQPIAGYDRYFPLAVTNIDSGRFAIATMGNPLQNSTTINQVDLKIRIIDTNLREIKVYDLIYPADLMVRLNTWYLSKNETKILLTPIPNQGLLVTLSKALNVITIRYNYLLPDVPIGPVTATKEISSNLQSESMFVFPNPVRAGGTLHLSQPTNMQNAKRATEVHFYQATGACAAKLTLANGQLVLPPSLAKGLYLLRIGTGSKWQNARLVIE